MGAVEDCSTRSEADFGDAYADDGNLVVGPLALVGAGGRTPPAVIEQFGGQKFPLLVRAGHVVTVRVPARARTLASLGYGPLPQGEVDFHDGHDTVTFRACGGGEPSGSTAGEPVTFWSGFLFALRPACVPLDVYVDARPVARRAEVELGRAC